MDPIAGQGANNGNKMARNLVRCIVEREDGAFDAAWMRSTFDRFWRRHKAIEEFNNTLLNPLTKAGRPILLAQYGSTAQPGDDRPQQRLANLFCDNFDDPAILTPAFHDEALARETITRYFGSARPPVAKALGRIAWQQVRQRLGRPAQHPGTRPTEVVA